MKLQPQTNGIRAVFNVMEDFVGFCVEGVFNFGDGSRALKCIRRFPADIEISASKQLRDLL
jgi:hypothetical protein